MRVSISQINKSIRFRCSIRRIVKRYSGCNFRPSWGYTSKMNFYRELRHILWPIIILFLFNLFLLALNSTGIKEIMGIKTSAIGYMCISILLILSGFINLHYYRKGVRREFNLPVMASLFFFGALTLFIGIITIIFPRH